MMICLAVFIEQWLVTDRQTDRRTPGHGTHCASIAEYRI